MAKTTRTTSTAKASAPGPRRGGRPPGSKSAKPDAAPAPRTTRRPAVAAKPIAVPRKPPAASSAPKLGKSELQAQVEKLERTVTTLRTRNRDAVRAAKVAAARIEELEEQLSTMRRQASKPPVPPSKAAGRSPKRAAAAPPDPKPPRSVRGRRLSTERDPGDAVPPGVAVRDPEPMDEEATAAFDSLQAQLHPADDDVDLR